MKTLTTSLLVAVLSASAWAQCTTTIPAPQIENFDTNAVQGSSASCTIGATNGTLPPGWILDPTSTTAWIVWSGATTSGSTTGPSFDNTTGTGQYVYMEASSPCHNVANSAILETPCFDITNVSGTPTLRFAYHMFGSDIGTLDVECWDGAAWVNVFSRSGDQGNQWRTAAIANVPNFVNGAGLNIRARFIATHSGIEFNGDIGLDDVGVGGDAQFQVNSQALSVSFDDTETGGLTAAATSLDIVQCQPIVPATTDFIVDSDRAGAGFDLVFNAGAVVGANAGGLTLPDGQLVNLNLASGLTYFSSGTAVPGSAVLPGAGIPGSSSVRITNQLALTTPVQISVQGFVLDASSSIGLTFSQACELTTNLVPLQPTVGPVASSTTNVTVPVTQAPTCYAPNGIPFYGTIQTEMFVSPNGFVAFGGGGDTDTTAGVLDALTDDGRVGFWTNFDPTEDPAADCVISSTFAGVVDIEYRSFPYDAEFGTLPSSSFTISIDSNNGVITLSGLQGIAANVPAGNPTTTDVQWLGISAGIVGTMAGPAINSGGPTEFTVGGSGMAASLQDLIFDYNDPVVSARGLPASLRNGVDVITFTPDGMGNYIWSAN